MIKKISLIVLFFLINLYAENINDKVILEGPNALKDKTYIDFGYQGKTYDIKEKNILEEYEKGLRKIKETYLNKKHIEKILKKKINKYALFNSKKPLCLRDEKIGPEVDWYTVPVDIINPLGRIVLRKGQKIRSTLPKDKTLDLCFIYGKGNYITTINEINYFSKKYPNCLFLVSNYNVLKLRDKFPKLEIYPSSIVQENRFNLKCYPAHLHFYDDKKEYEYFNYNRFKN
jgi:hypothetical protein